MTSFGVLSTGFAKKLLEDIVDDIEADQLANISPNLNQLPSSLLGQLNGIFGDKLRELWDVAEAVYNAAYPDSAAGDALDRVSGITGARRLTATRSTVTLEVNLDAGTSLPIGRIVQNPTTGVQFQTTEVVTNGGGGAANFNVEAESVELGAIVALAGTLTEIVTPVVGWNSSTNLLDADPGREVESDPDFRIRRESLLRIAGSCTVEAIRSALLDDINITQAIVFENETDFVDINGLPPHSFEAVVKGASDPEVAQIIFENKAAGIQTFGTSSEIIVDSQGVNRTINFSRPTEIDIWIDVTVQIDPTLYPIDGDDQVKAALVALGDTQQVGEDVIALRYLCAPLEVSGVIDVTAFIIDTGPIPPGTNTGNIAIALRELAVFDTSRIDVVTV